MCVQIYIPTRDRSLCGAWIAIDDATIENGCMWCELAHSARALPSSLSDGFPGRMIDGSHKPGVMYPMKPHSEFPLCALWASQHSTGLASSHSCAEDSRFDPAGESYGFPYPRESGIAVRTSADSLVGSTRSMLLLCAASQVPCPSGSVVFFNGYTLHRSLPNVRRALPATGLKRVWYLVIAAHQGFPPRVHHSLHVCRIFPSVGLRWHHCKRKASCSPH